MKINLIVNAQPLERVDVELTEQAARMLLLRIEDGNAPTKDYGKTLFGSDGNRRGIGHYYSEGDLAKVYDVNTKKNYEFPMTRNFYLASIVTECSCWAAEENAKNLKIALANHIDSSTVKNLAETSITNTNKTNNAEDKKTKDQRIESFQITEGADQNEKRSKCLIM